MTCCTVLYVIEMKLIFEKELLNYFILMITNLCSIGIAT